MSRQEIKQNIEKLITPEIKKLNLELIDLTFSREGEKWFLRIYIDKPGNVTLEDCERVSRRLDIFLDEVDLIPQSYILEVSSPGIERPLKKEKDFYRYIGKKIKLKTFRPINGQKNFIAVLKNVFEQSIFLETEQGKNIEVLFNNITKANLIYQPKRKS